MKIVRHIGADRQRPLGSGIPLVWAAHSSKGSTNISFIGSPTRTSTENFAKLNRKMNDTDNERQASGRRSRPKYRPFISGMYVL